MSKLQTAFKDNKALIPFLTCGDPDLETTEAAVRAAVENGADIIELGIPFSDPTAEGPVIQAASERALSGGITVDDIFACVRRLRKDVSIPLVFMTYCNVVFSYGTEKFLAAMQGLSMDGLILADLPYEEKDEFLPVCQSHGIDLISFIAPTSEDRIPMIAKEATGFLYVISSLGVTGTRTNIRSDYASMIRTVHSCSSVPCAVGFGVSTPEQAGEIAKDADGVIVGSAIVKLLAAYGRQAPEHIGHFVGELKAALSDK